MANVSARQRRLEEALRQRMAKSSADREKAKTVLSDLLEEIKALLGDVSGAFRAVWGLRKCQVESSSDLDNLILKERLTCEPGYLEIEVEYSMEREGDRYLVAVASELADIEDFARDYVFFEEEDRGKIGRWIESTVIEALMLENHYKEK